jgi:hypothetical protein
MPDENRPVIGGFSLDSVREARERLEQDDPQESPAEEARRRSDELRQARDELRRLREED